MGVKDADFRNVSIAVILGSDSTRFQRLTNKGKQELAKDKRTMQYQKHTDASVARVEKRGDSVRMEQHERCPSCKSLDTRLNDASVNASLGMDEGNGTTLYCNNCEFVFAITKK